MNVTDQARWEAHTRIVDMWRQGVPPKSIAYELGYSHGRVNAIISGVAGSHASRIAARNERLMALWRTGVPSAGIGKQLGMTPSAVIAMVHLLRKRGVDLPIRKRSRNV